MFFVHSKVWFRVLPLFLVSLVFCLTNPLTWAQVILTYRPLTGFLLSADAPVNHDKPTLLVFEAADAFARAFRPAPAPGKRPGQIVATPDFSKDMVVGVALPPTSRPPKLAIRKVFVQDSTLTVRYVRLTDTTLANRPLPFPIQPTLLLAIPKQTVLKTKLVENGKVVQVLKQAETEH